MTRTISKLGGVLALVVITALACSRNSTMVHIQNASTMDIKGVVLSGSGFRITAPDIPAGGEVEIAVVSRGESGLSVVFVANGRTVSIPKQGYFEGGGSYAGSAVIKPDLSISVEFRLAA